MTSHVRLTLSTLKEYCQKNLPKKTFMDTHQFRFQETLFAPQGRSELNLKSNVCTETQSQKVHYVVYGK